MTTGRPADPPLSLHAAIVPSFIQILRSMDLLLDIAIAHCENRRIDPSFILDARLADDMRPFAYQIEATALHSAGAIEAVRNGEAAPRRIPWPNDFTTLRARLSDAIAALDDCSPQELESLRTRRVTFTTATEATTFTADHYLLSFAQPNFYFHATTAYAILRNVGLPLTKRDFLGETRAVMRSPR